MKAVDGHHGKAGGVPNFINEIAVGADFIFGNNKIRGRSNAVNKGKTESIGAIFFGHQKRINNIAFAFAHFLTFGVNHPGMKMNSFKRNIAG